MVNADADGEKVPVPEVLQVPAVVEPVTVPVKATVDPSQIVRSLPTVTTGTGRICRTFASLIGAQPLFDVNVRVTLPAEISAALAV